MVRRIGEHAVVLGAGVAGLLAARVLAEAFEQVTIVERDPLPPVGQSRKGVPQGRHAHVLLPRGQRVIDELFPGLADELIAGGAVVADPGVDHRYIFGGHPLRRAPGVDRALQASRPLLEGHLRERVHLLPGVTIVEGCDVVGVTVADLRRVTGARIIRRVAGSTEEEVAADLVVDAMGRGSRMPVWLQGLGYDQAPAEEVGTNVFYASRYLRLPPDASGLGKAVVVGPRPGLSRGLAMAAVEADRWLLTVAGVHDSNRPPTDPEGFLAFAATIAPGDVSAAIQAAQPLGGITAHRHPSDLRRRYERLRCLPNGLIVTGDALCAFNPIYAQGMTVAALDAGVLRRCLARGQDGLTRRYFHAAAKALDTPWRMATAAALAMPEVDGKRTRTTRLLGAYTDSVQAAAEHDATVAEQFMRVVGLLDPPARLIRPAILARTLRARRRRRTVPDAVPDAVRITGTASSVVPFLHLPVHAEAAGPVEARR